MKYYLSFIFMALSSLLYAAPASFTGKVVYLGAKMNTARVPSEYSYIQVAGINPSDSKVAGCYSSDRGNGSLPIFYIPEQEQDLYSLLLAAYMGDKSAQITIDNDASYKVDGLCRLESATLSKSF